MDTEDKVASCVGWIVGAAALLVVGVLANGWALSTIWNWFVPPIFHLVNLTIMQAIGIAMVFELFTGTNKLNKSESKSNQSASEKLIEAIVLAIATPVIQVGIAWVILQFAF